MKINSIWTGQESFVVGGVCDDGFKVGAIEINLVSAMREDWFLIIDDIGKLKKLVNPAHVVSVDVE